MDGHQLAPNGADNHKDVRKVTIKVYKVVMSMKNAITSSHKQHIALRNKPDHPQTKSPKQDFTRRRSDGFLSLPPAGTRSVVVSAGL